MDEKIVCPHCQYQYKRDEISGTLSSGKFLCFICNKRFSEYSNHISKHSNFRVYIIPLIILLIAFIFIVIGIKISTSEDRHFKIAMKSTDLEQIESSIVKISDMDKLDLICKRFKENASNASRNASISKDNKDIETTDKWATAAFACLMQQQTILKDQLKKAEELNKSTYDQSIFLPLMIIFLVIASGIILFIKFGLSRFMGIILIVISLLGLIVSLTMKTTVGSTYNIGLLSKQQNLIIISLATFLAGIIIQVVSYFSINKNQKADK